MAITPFAFNPVNGLDNTTSFPQKPATQSNARGQFSVLFNQIRDWINSILMNGNGTITADNATVGSNLADGWTLTPQVLTFLSSADAPTFTATTSADLTPFISVGMKIMLTNTTVKYFIVTAITPSAITLYGGTDFSLTNSAISNVYYSTQKSPFGFPVDKNKWSVIVTDTTDRTQTSPTGGAWYNPGGISIPLPIGEFDVSYTTPAFAAYSSATNIGVKSTLSTSATAESDTDLTATYYGGALTSFAMTFLVPPKPILLAVKTIYYLNYMAVYTGASSVGAGSSNKKTVIRAVCAYL
jgi:hypothetical protein